jgi:hypothetical protein
VQRVRELEGAGFGNHLGPCFCRALLARERAYYRDVSDYLVESVLLGDRLIGRYQNLCVASDSTPWVGVVANEARIYGLWEKGRWDFFKQERPR